MMAEDVKKRLEMGICSPGRLRIIAYLANPEKKPLSKYQLEKMTGVRSRSLNSDLSVLMQLNWVKELKISERRKLFTLNSNDELLRKLLIFLDGAGYLQFNY